MMRKLGESGDLEKRCQDWTVGPPNSELKKEDVLAKKSPEIRENTVRAQCVENQERKVFQKGRNINLVKVTETWK